MELLTVSSYGRGLSEGLYLRIDQGNWHINRAKLVRPEFIQTIEAHWSKKRNRAQSIGCYLFYRLAHGTLTFIGKGLLATIRRIVEKHDAQWLLE
jgi:hypothetical protein